MSDSKTLPPEFAATAGDLMAYRARERFTVFEAACLLHRADPEKVHNDTWNGWRDRKLQTGFDRAELTPALFVGELDLMPELLAGPLIGGTIKRLKKAIGCATIMHSIGADQARTLADSLGLAFPPELSAAQPQQLAPVLSFTSFGRTAFMQLIRFEERRLLAHEIKPDGVYVARPDATEIRLGMTEPKAAHPTGDYDAPALPFPFTLAQFLAFEKAADAYGCGIVGQMHDDEIAALAEKSPMAYQLAMAARYVEDGGLIGDLVNAKEPQAEAPAVGASGGGAVPAPDPERRLALLRALGGSANLRRGEWKFTGIKALVDAERNEGRKRRDEKTIRADLREAAEAEREAKRAGHWDGLRG